MNYKTALIVMLSLLPPACIGQGFQDSIPNGRPFFNPSGASSTYSTSGKIDLKGPFFQSMGSNGRSCASCHQTSDGMSVSAAHIEDRFLASGGLDPIFRTVDGSNCNHDIDVSTVKGRRAAYKLLRTRGLLRIAIAVPANADYEIVRVDNPYGCNETDTISQYRRPLPSTNLRFLSAVMFDGRESSPLTGTTKILPTNYPASLQSDLRHQSVSATTNHAQGNGKRPTPAEQQQIVDFEMSLFTAQTYGWTTGSLDARGATGGPEALMTQPFFIGVNSPIPDFENPASAPFNSAIFNAFDAFDNLPQRDPRAAIARGQALFNSTPINIRGVAGLNDDQAAGGLVPGGIPVIAGFCGTCHDSPNVGNHSFPTPLNIGTGDPNPGDPTVNLGGLDVTYLPRITVRSKITGETKTTTDLGQALVDGKFDHVGKIKGPILRGLSARAPYFHNGSARTLLDVVRFYELRFGVFFSPQEEDDLVAFLSSL
jgi:hypothetical protein